MYLFCDLEPATASGDQVKCPVRGCDTWVERQPTSHLKRDARYYCDRHRIYISPSTFEYEDKRRNLLWTEEEDRRLLGGIEHDKRESRMARERSEDALTWNVFRFVQRERRLSAFVRLLFPAEELHSDTDADTDLIYWSYSSNTRNAWGPLIQAREAFGEHTRTGSEPDLIVDTGDCLIFIEAKFTASNNITVDKESKLPKYENGADRWYGQAFAAPALHIAIKMKLYELMRFWLLGSWMAAKMNKSFVLLSLTRELMDPDLTNRVTPLLRQDGRRRFQHLSWERVYAFIRDGVQDSTGRGNLLTYMRHKTAGYSGGRLQRAFQIEETDPSCHR